MGLLLTIGLWELFARQMTGSFLIAGPLDIIRHLYENAGPIYRALKTTFHSAALGFLYGNLAAMALAAAIILVPRLERLILSLGLIIFCLPLVATGPILRVLYGPGIGPQITLAALAVYYTTLLALLVGLRAFPQNWAELVQSYGRGRFVLLSQIRAMVCVPYLIAGLQIAAPAAFLGAMIGEFTGAERGLGVLTLQAMRSLDTVATWSIATVAATVSILAYLALDHLNHMLKIAKPELILANTPNLVKSSITRRLLNSVAITLVVLMLWQGLMDALALNQFFAKRPGDLWRFLVTSTDAGAARTTLWSALTETLSLTLPGYLAGLFLGAGLAAILCLVPSLSTAILPIAITLRSVPIITTAPLLVLAMGRGAIGTMSIVAVMIFFPTFVSCQRGLAQAPGQVIDVFDTYAAGRFRLMIWAQFPATLPAFFAAARMAVPTAILAVTTTEWLATGRGIGTLMALTASTSDYNMLWSAVTALTLISVIGYRAVELLEQSVLRHYASEQVRR